MVPKFRNCRAKPQTNSCSADVLPLRFVFGTFPQTCLTEMLTDVSLDETAQSHPSIDSSVFADNKFENSSPQICASWLVGAN